MVFMNKKKQLIELAKLDGFKNPSEEGILEEDVYLTRLKVFDYIPNYLSDFNAIYSLEAHLGLHDINNIEIRVRFINFLHAIVSRRCPVNKSGMPMVSDVTKFFATAEERAECILKTFKKWEKSLAK